MFKRMGNMGGNVLSFGKNRAIIVAEGQTGVTFDDVAGADEAKEELAEVVDFSRTPRSIQRSAGRFPRVFCWWARPVREDPSCAGRRRSRACTLLQDERRGFF
jgi:ATP-dependent Zn protease